MSELNIICPSGLKGVVRGLKGREIDLFANKQEVRKRRIGSKILQACWLRTTEVGPAYPGQEVDSHVNWDHVLTADRFFILLKIREATYGSNYIFGWQCDRCEKRFEWELDLNDLPYKPLAESDIQKFVSGNEFDLELGDDKIVFKLPIGSDEKRALDARDLAPNRVATTALLGRVVAVNGETNKSALTTWAEDLDVADAMDLIDCFDEHDGGVDTDIEVQCPHCGNIMDVTLPLDEDFWTPKKSRRSKKRRDATASSLDS